MFRISHYPGYYNRDEYYRNCKFPLFFNSHDSHFIGYYVFCPKVVFKSDETATKKISDFFVGFDDLLVMNLKNHIVEAINQSSSILKKAKGKQATAIGGMRGTSNLSSLLSQTVIIDQACFLYVIKAIPIGGISAARYFAATIFANTTGMLANFMEVKTTAPIFEKYVSFLLEDSFSEQQNSIKLQKLDNQQPQITFDSVDFSYNTNTVLESCSFNFARGLVQKKVNLVS